MLSDAEKQVTVLVAEGLSNKQIALRVGRSDKTVKNQVSAAMAKINAKSRVQLALWAIRSGLVKVNPIESPA